MVAASLVLAANAMADSPVVFGPTYPLPGVSDTAHQSHGGSTCYHSGSVYAGGTLTWVLGPDPANDMPSKDTSTECDDAAAPTTPFDLTRFQRLYWGIDPANTHFSYCAPSAPGDVCTGPVVDSGPMTYDSADSDPANGKLVYQGTQTTTDKLTVHLPGAATDASTIGSFHDLHTYADQATEAAAIGQVWQVSGTTSPTFTMTYSMNNSPLPTGTCNCRTVVSISGGFYYVDLPPGGSITPDPNPPTNHVADTFTATGVTDPYAAEDSPATPTYAWDLSGGTTYADGSSNSAQDTYGPGFC